jgi:hypothetical protein
MEDNFYSNSLRYLEQCKIAFASRFAPPFICSIGSHILNLENRKREFFTEHGRIGNLRVHVFFCAPPGHMKTLMLQKFLDGPTSIAGGVEDLQTGFEGAMTEAGFTGTIKVVNGEPVKQFGAAYDHREGMIGIDEFAALTNSMKQEHSINLDSAMLTALDSGFVVKRLALGKIQYITDMTLLTGSQPARFNLTSGLGRRFIFIYFIPTRDESNEIKASRRQAKLAFPSTTTLYNLKANLHKMIESAHLVQKITFDKSIYDKLDRLSVPHYEEMLFERVAVGYTSAIQNGGGDSTLAVTMDPELGNIFQKIYQWRLEIKKGAETTEVYQVVREMDLCTVTQVKNRLTDFGLEYNKSTELLESLRRQGRIMFIKEKAGVHGGRPATVIKVLEHDDA